MLEKTSQFLSSEQPCEPEGFDVASTIAGVKKKLTFPSVQKTVNTLIDVRNETSKHHFLKSVKENKLT